MNTKWLFRWRYPQWGKAKASPTLHYLQQAKLLRTKRRTKWVKTSHRGTVEETDEWVKTSQRGTTEEANEWVKTSHRGTTEETDEWVNLSQGSMTASIPGEEKNKWETAMWGRNPRHEDKPNKEKYTQKGTPPNEQLRKRYQGVQKKLYQKYNHQGVGSDPNKVETYERNYEQVNELNIHRMLLLGLETLNINELNKMQINSFLTIQQGKDVLINYPDGSGKTIAYLLPLLNNIYFVHDYLEELILESYHGGKKKKCGNSVQENFKFSNNFDLYNEMRKYFLKYSHYRRNVLLEDNTTQVGKKMNQKFHLLPNHFDELDEESIRGYPHLEVEAKQRNVSLMNKLIEVIKINKINLNNINSDHANREELAKLENILMYNFKVKEKEPNCVASPPDNDECIYRYLTRNPLQINKPIIILTVNKDNISQIVQVIKKLDVLNRINIQTLNDVPYQDRTYSTVDERTHIESLNEKVQMQLEKNSHLENLHVVRVNRVPNPVLCKDEIMWTCADIVITTPDIFLHAYQNERTKQILPSMIIFDEVDMLFQNNAYRNTMMNIFHLVKRRPEIYNPHIDISTAGLEDVATSIEAALASGGKEAAPLASGGKEAAPLASGGEEAPPLTSSGVKAAPLASGGEDAAPLTSGGEDAAPFGQPQVLSTFQSGLHSVVSDFERGQFGDLDMSPVEGAKGGNPAGDYHPKNASHGKKAADLTPRAKEKARELPLLQMIYVSSTLPSVGHTTAGSMLAERFSNLVEIVCRENYHIPRNVRTQWIELNRDKILSHYLFSGGTGDTHEGEDSSGIAAKDEGNATQYSGFADQRSGPPAQHSNSDTHHGGSLKDAALSSKINKLENSSFEHRLDLLIHVLKKYHEWSASTEWHKHAEFSEHGQAKKDTTTNPEGGEKKNFASPTKGGKFHLIDNKAVYKTIVFVNSVKDCIRIYFFLKKHNWPVFCFHKNISINSRMQNLHNFHHSHVAILVTTDLLSRGIDTKNVDHIINFHFPSDAITYLHRLGKMNRSGDDHHNGLNHHSNAERGQMLHRRHIPLEEEHIGGEAQTKWSHQGDTTWEYIPTHGQDKDNTFLRTNKNFLVTNFLSFSNLPLAQSIRSCDQQNASLLPLFSRKKSFKMKIKRKENNALGEDNRYIDIGAEEEDDINMDGDFPNVREIGSQSRHSSHQGEAQFENGHSREPSTCENDEKNVYVQAPFSVFSLDDLGEESHGSDTDEEGAAAEGADGDLTDGDLTDGDLTDGDLTDGDLTDGDLTDGDLTDGNLTDGDLTDEDLTDGDLTGEDHTDEDHTDEATPPHNKFAQRRAATKGKTETKHNPRADDDHAEEFPGETPSCEEKKNRFEDITSRECLPVMPSLVIKSHPGMTSNLTRKNF
ncbi:helicase [Plasmodium cynomolgi strain B]|uniref:ATP-dependent RNA helicase n=1 Tax=Plasmodium cynomolgi (strain B) TaxID=1120755 RepID=K6UVL2_PLACD|nr:helicase [Plasmodium cynomolgi strain B]GAB66350.1 helicase [Plasmodium cynomolgi strain B]